MFSTENARWYPAPSSSPPSSPTAYNDSSPASSPGPDHDDPLVFSDSYTGGEASHASPPMHPFAASAKASWIPPEYEKGAKKSRQKSPSSPSRSRSKKPRLVGPDSSFETVVSAPTRVFATPTEEEAEAAIWDAAITKMYDSVNGTIELQSSNLTSIPEKVVEDLQRFFVPPEKFERVNAPSRIAAIASPPLQQSREFSRSKTAPAIFSCVPDRTVGSARQEIKLYLAGNQISQLPDSLLYLDNLTVLSLRNNRLKVLPAEIRHLKQLHTLNVSGNQLKFLPAEILDMTLKVLNVFPNPFEEQPMPSPQHLARPSASPPWLSLLSAPFFSTESAEQTNYAERRIEKFYELPLCEADFVGSSSPGKKEFRQVVPPHLRHVLHAIHPGSVDVDPSWKPADDDRPTLGFCPSPRHPHRATVFVNPAEVRYTWETVVAGVDVGGGVPLKWRGCLWGCLDFLSPEVETEPTVKADVQTKMDVDEEHEVVTRLQFTSDGFGMDDFEDE
ncbi:Leucine-rich repeat-containing protein 10B [Mycena venus]|uniref:Leucine-rich repeat-containing protein 10B n=1 Tax=Mycena venus TaxID=2733690 RepID=A0A8H7D2S3_9AGAR|nr:Leucine-rich repeat-containing protein 10B [Mycena venus]